MTEADGQCCLATNARNECISLGFELLAIFEKLVFFDNFKNNHGTPMEHIESNDSLDSKL